MGLVFWWRMDSIVSYFTWGCWKSAASSMNLFYNVFEHWFSMDCEGLKKYAVHACSVCSLKLAVASTENGFFSKWLKTLPTPYLYIPVKQKGFAQLHVLSLYSAPILVPVFV